MRTSLRRTLATATAAALLAGLTACGGDDAGDAADEPTAASEATSSEPADNESEDAEEPADDAPAEGEVVDPEEFLDRFQNGVENSTTAHMTMTTGLSGMNIDAEGDVDYTTDPPAMAMTMSIPALSASGEIEMRFVDGVFYMNMGQTTQGKFLKLDPDDPSNPMGDIGELVDSMDPVRSVEQFADGLKSVIYVGEEETESGDEADHYVLTLDTTKVESLKDAGAAGLPQELDYDMWLDDEDRMRQVQIDMGSTGTVFIGVDDWDVPVDIEAPSADELMEMPQR